MKEALTSKTESSASTARQIISRRAFAVGRLMAWLQVWAVCLGVSFAQEAANDQNALATKTAQEIKEAIDRRYAGLAASSSAYMDAIRKVVEIRARKEQTTDGRLANAWVKKVGEGYLAVAAASQECSDAADKMDGADWSSSFHTQVQRLEKLKKEDMSAKQKAQDDKDTLMQIPPGKQSVAEKSRISSREITIESTNIRLKVYDKSLEIFERMDRLVNANDKLVTQYRDIFRNMSESYSEMAKTIFAVRDMETLNNLEKALNKIGHQPSVLREDATRARMEWSAIRAEIQKIVGGQLSAN